MGFEVAIPDPELDKIGNLCYAIDVFKRYAPLHCIEGFNSLLACAEVFDILQQLIGSSALPGYYIDAKKDFVVLRELGGRGICVVRPDGSMSGDCHGVDRGELKAALYRLADWYYTMIVYVLDSEYAERLSDRAIEYMTKALERLAEMGASIDPELYGRLGELEKSLRVRIRRVRDDVAGRLVSYSRLLPRVCELQLGQAEVELGAFNPFEYFNTEPYVYIRYDNSLGIGLVLANDGQGYLLTAKPVVWKNTVIEAADVDMLSNMMKRWREAVLDTLTSVAEAEKMGVKMKDETWSHCIDVVNKWIDVLNEGLEK